MMVFIGALAVCVLGCQSHPCRVGHVAPSFGIGLAKGEIREDGTERGETRKGVDLSEASPKLTIDWTLSAKAHPGGDPIMSMT